jgi:hypothetical protein
MINRISGFGQLALNTDVQKTLLQPGVWSRLDNIDVESGDIRSARGESLVTGNPPCEPRYMYRFDGALSRWLIISDGVGIFAYDGKTWQDIRTTASVIPAQTWQDLHDSSTTWQDLRDNDTTWGELSQGIDPGDPAFAGRVTFTTFLGTLIVCPSQGIPSYWPGESGRLLPLPGWDSGAVAQQIIAYANHLVAIGYDDGTLEGHKYRVAWSDAAAEGTVPQTWDFADTTKLAGSVQLRDTPGALVVAEILRNDLIIYKSDSIYRMFLRGDELIMGFERVIADHGCDAWRGVVHIGNIQFFADSGDIRVFDGQTTESVTELRIKESLAAAISNEFRDETILAAHTHLNQLWVAPVRAGSDTFETVLVYDIVHGSWTSKKHENGISMAGGHMNSIAETGLGTWQSLRDTNTTWQNLLDSGVTWSSSFTDPSERSITLATTTAISQVDETNTDANGQAKFCFAERRGFVMADMSQRVTLKRVYPEMEGDAVVSIQIGAQWVPGETIRWTPPQDFVVGVDRVLNTRISGQPCAVRVQSSDARKWRLGALSFEVVEAGRR